MKVQNSWFDKKDNWFEKNLPTLTSWLEYFVKEAGIPLLAGLFVTFMLVLAMALTSIILGDVPQPAVVVETPTKLVEFRKKAAEAMRYGTYSWGKFKGRESAVLRNHYQVAPGIYYYKNDGTHSLNSYAPVNCIVGAKYFTIQTELDGKVYRCVSTLGFSDKPGAVSSFSQTVWEEL